MIEVVEQQVDRGDALDDAALDLLPFVGRQHARDRVERQDAVDRLAVGIDREGDAEIVERLLGAGGAALELADRHAAEPVADVRGRRAAQHLAIKAAGIVGIENELTHLAPRYPLCRVGVMHGMGQGGAAYRAPTASIPAMPRKPSHMVLPSRIELVG